MTADIGMKAYEMGGVYVAKTICLLGWLTESIKCILTGTLDSLGKMSIKWISFVLIVKFLPSVLDLLSPELPQMRKFSMRLKIY